MAASLAFNILFMLIILSIPVVYLVIRMVLLGTGTAFALLIYRWAKAERELLGWLEEKMSSLLEE